MSVRVTFKIDEPLTVSEVDEIIRQAFEGQPDGQAKLVITGGVVAAGMVLNVDRTTWQVTGR